MRLLLVVALLVPPGAFADMYKCVDERGKATYGDKPGPGCKRVDIQGSPPISGSLQGGASNAAQDEANFRQRQIARQRAEEAEKRAQDAQLERCAAVRREVGRLSSGRRIVEKFTESGERVFMDDQEREQRVAKARADLAGCP